MKAIVRDKPEEILLQTISLAVNREHPDTLYLFRCYTCGTGVQKIQGDVVAISAGLIPTPDVTTISQCHNCRKNYTFQTTKAYKDSITRLSLTHEKGAQVFHCFICRMQLVQYSVSAAALLPEFVEMHLPTGFSCFNPLCSKKFVLEEIVSE